MTLHVVKYHVGQIIDHIKFGYRGVVYDVDAQFSASEEWYENVAQSKPPKDAPWYHVLVDGSDSTTYVAERNLVSASDISEINHPLIEIYFLKYSDGHYVLPGRQ